MTDENQEEPKNWLVYSVFDVLALAALMSNAWTVRRLK